MYTTHASLFNQMRSSKDRQVHNHNHQNVNKEVYGKFWQVRWRPVFYLHFPAPDCHSKWLKHHQCNSTRQFLKVIENPRPQTSPSHLPLSDCWWCHRQCVRFPRSFMTWILAMNMAMMKLTSVFSKCLIICNNLNWGMRHQIWQLCQALVPSQGFRQGDHLLVKRRPFNSKNLLAIFDISANPPSPRAVPIIPVA